MADSILIIDDDILARIKAAAADRLAPSAVRWRQVWVPVAFAVGALLLALAAPQWMRGVQLAIHELPTTEMVWNWLSEVLFDPVTTLNPLLAQVTQTWLYTGGPMDAMTTLGVIVLAVASVAGLGQLLGGEHKTTFRRAIPKDIQAGDR